MIDVVDYVSFLYSRLHESLEFELLGLFVFFLAFWSLGVFLMFFFELNIFFL